MRLLSSTSIHWMAWPSMLPWSTAVSTSDSSLPWTLLGRPRRNSGLTMRAMAARPRTTISSWRQTGTGCSFGLRACPRGGPAGFFRFFFTGASFLLDLLFGIGGAEVEQKGQSVRH